MEDCLICANNAVCKYKEKTAELKNEVKALDEKYTKDFFGRILVKCDYFVDNSRPQFTQRG